MSTYRLVQELIDRGCLLGAYHLLQIRPEGHPEVARGWGNLFISVHSYLSDASDEHCLADITPSISATADSHIWGELDRINRQIKRYKMLDHGDHVINGARAMYAIKQMDGIRAEIILNRIIENVENIEDVNVAIIEIDKNNDSTATYLKAEKVRLHLKKNGISMDDSLHHLMPRYRNSQIN